MDNIFSVAAATFAFAIVGTASADEAKDCHSVTDAKARLECYDEATEFNEGEAHKAALLQALEDAGVVEAEKPKALSKWTSSTSVSDLDDSKNIILRLESDNEIRGKYGDSGPMMMYIRCSENTTSIYFTFNGHFMSDHQYGQVTYRLDEKKAVKKGMQESTDHEALGLWRGGSSIPFIKGMLGNEKMLVQATPHSESSVKSTFSIAGLEDEIKPLREACNW